MSKLYIKTQERERRSYEITKEQLPLVILYLYLNTATCKEKKTASELKLVDAIKAAEKECARWPGFVTKEKGGVASRSVRITQPKLRKIQLGRGCPSVLIGAQKVSATAVSIEGWITRREKQSSQAEELEGEVEQEKEKSPEILAEIEKFVTKLESFKQLETLLPQKAYNDVNKNISVEEYLLSSIRLDDVEVTICSKDSVSGEMISLTYKDQEFNSGVYTSSIFEQNGGAESSGKRITEQITEEGAALGKMREHYSAREDDGSVCSLM